MGDGPDADAAPPGAWPRSLVLPRSEALAQILSAPAVHAVSDGELTALRDDMAGELQAVAADLPDGQHLHLDAFAVRTARRHPERCGAPDASFVPSPRRCRRAVGVAAAGRCVRGRARGPAVAVADVLAAGVEDLRAPEGAGVRAPWWAEWYAGLPTGGRAVVQAEATGWATRLFGAVAWDSLPRPAVIGGRDDWWRCPGERQLTLQGRAEARVQGASHGALLVVGGGRCPDDWRLELGYPGLVADLVRPAPTAPCRVVGVWPDSGQVRVLPLDAPTLRTLATAVVSAVGTWVDARIEAHHRATGPHRSRPAVDPRQGV